MSSVIEQTLRHLLEDEDSVKDLGADFPEPPHEVDFKVSFHGSLCLVHPQNEQATAWLRETAPPDAQFFGGGMVVEPRYIRGVVEAIVNDGFTTNLKLAEAEEGEEEDAFKEITGGEYVDPEKVPPLPGRVDRHDRWVNVSIGNDAFCISYLTPVAVYLSGRGCMISGNSWSHATINHIKKWMDEIGMSRPERWHEMLEHFPTIPQDDLVEMFRKKALRVRLTKREAKSLSSVPYNRIATGLRDNPDYRVRVEPDREPTEYD